MEDSVTEEQAFAEAQAFRAATMSERPRKIRQYVVGALTMAALGAVVGLADAAESEFLLKEDSNASSGANAVIGGTRSGTEAIGLAANRDQYRVGKGIVGNAPVKTVNGGAKTADSESRVQVRFAQNAAGEPTSETMRPSLDQFSNLGESCEPWNDPKIWENATIHAAAGCLAAGADLDARDHGGWTRLHYAARNSTDPEIVDALVEAGADPNIRDNRGETPLHVAAEHSGIPDVVRTLLEAEADPAARSNSGEFPADLAEENQSMRGTAVYRRLNDARLNAR